MGSGSAGGMSLGRGSGQNLEISGRSGTTLHCPKPAGRAHEQARPMPRSSGTH